MNCLIVGSVALKYHIQEIYREPADIDLMVDSEETKQYILSNKEKISEVMSYLNIDYKKYKVNFLPVEDLSNKLIFESLTNQDESILNINVASLALLKLCKLASIPWNLQKHTLDLDFLKDIKLNDAHNEILKIRLEETKNRACLQKDYFFSRTVSRYISHDRLHFYVSPTPAYKLILKDNHYYKGCKDKFNKLEYNQQFLVVAEEIFVFSLERWFIPEFIQNKLAMAKLCEKFTYDLSTNGPMQYWIFKFMENGGVKGNPSWISHWLSENYKDFILKMNTWWGESFNNLPEAFWLELLEKNEKDLL